MKGGKRHRQADDIAIEDFQFLMRTELLEATPEKFKRELIACMKKASVVAGETFIVQGDKGDSLYLIQEGSCIVSLDKNGQSYPITRLKRGEIVGELAVLTGETRSANVHAETDMALWVLSLESFEVISGRCRPLLDFLTDISTERLCSRKITAERSIGRYTIHDMLAEGGWSIVYRGVHSYLNFPVAIKMLKHNMARDPEFLGKFQDEAKIIAQLNHDNIVKVYDIEHVSRTVFIIMEHLEGITLRHILRNKLRLPYPRMLQILVQVCAGLEYAHQQGIVHQDVKPGNIFIENSDRVKIVDFGLASPIGGCSDDLPGTVFYMAPEQIEGEPVDARTDVYSLGITAFEMATGRRPFPDDVCSVLKAHITESTPDPRIFNPDLPPEFGAFISKATQKDPAARYQNCREVILDLTRLASKAGERVAPESHPKRRMMTLFMFYRDESQLELNQIMEELSQQLKALGAELRIADFEGV
ncbi:MAG: protein kinase [Desulfomonile tiedjei]|uniref:Protein kinase n=1 Tax=Desulfomonile tiedjei TaxID=2358 RepID=A0A9D6V353_9BACT|nr:protein kinase [Desulfomonile tiedjei]